MKEREVLAFITQDVLWRRADLTILHLYMAHYWENHWNVLQANPRKLKFKRVGEYVEEISFFLLLVKIYFLIMLWIDLVSCDGVSDKEIESLEQNQIFKPQYLYPML